MFGNMLHIRVIPLLVSICCCMYLAELIIQSIRLGSLHSLVYLPFVSCSDDCLCLSSVLSIIVLACFWSLFSFNMLFILYVLSIFS